MACIHLGDFRGPACDFHRYKLFAAKSLLESIQTLHAHHDGRFPPVSYLAPHRGIEDLWIQISKGCLYHDM